MIETLEDSQNAIKEIQATMGWTLTRLARKARIAKPQPTRILAGKHDPTDATMRKLDILLKRIRKRNPARKTGLDKNSTRE